MQSDLEKAQGVTDPIESHHVEVSEAPGSKMITNNVSAGEHPDTPEHNVKWTTKMIVTVWFLFMTFVGSQMPLYFVAGPLAYIAKDTGAGSSSSWIAVCYTLGFAIPVPFGGYLQDIIGRRTIAIGSGCLVIIGSAIVGSSHVFPQVIAGMTIAGIGAGIGELSALAGTSEIVPIKHRGYMTAGLIAFALPVLPYVLESLLLAKYATWRWGLWITCIYEGIAVIGLILFYKPTLHSRLQGVPPKEIIKQIDYIGGALFIIGITLFLVALQSGGITHPWTSAYVLCNLLIGFALLSAFLFWEVYYAEVPILPKELFQRRIVMIAYIVTFIVGVNYYSFTSFAPIFFTNVYPSDVVTIGLRNITFGPVVTVGAVLGNIWLSVAPGQARILICGSGILMTTFLAALAASDPTNVTRTTVFVAMAGLGTGGLLIPAATIAIIASPDNLIATTGALTLAIRAIGGSIGSSIYYNILGSKIKNHLPEYVAMYAVKAGLPISSAEEFVSTFLTTGNVTNIPGATATIIAAAGLGQQWAWSESLKYVFYTTIPFGIVAVVVSTFIKGVETYSTSKVVAHLT